MEKKHLIIIVAVILAAALGLGLWLRLGAEEVPQPPVDETTETTLPVETTAETTLPTEETTQPTAETTVVTEPTQPATQPVEVTTQPTQPTEPSCAHSFQKGETVAPALDHAGYTLYTCSLCGYSYRGDPVAALSLQQVVNSLPLKPAVTGVAQLDALVADTLSKITTENQTTYEKLQAIYQHLIARTPQSVAVDMTDAVKFAGDTVYANISELVISYEAYQFLSEGKGVSDHFAAAFAVLTRAVGLESYVVNGSLNGSNHVWNNVVIGGEYYAFDTSTATAPQFALADSELAGYTYRNREGALAAQQGFQKAAPLTVKLTITDDTGTTEHTITWSAGEIRSGANSYMRNLKTLRLKGDVTYTLTVVSGGSKVCVTDEKETRQELTVGGSISGQLTAASGYYTLTVEDTASLMLLEIRVDN